MKKTRSILAALILSVSMFLPQQAKAQAPKKISYQTIVRNASNNLAVATAVGMQISILQTSAQGTEVYVETHTTTTNANGLVSLEIGTGTPSTGTFEAINWANGPYFVKAEIDPANGTNYTITGTSQLLSVPYALFSAEVAPKIYSIGLWPELGGYVFRIFADGKHGLVAETQDQGFTIWYEAQNLIANPTNHSVNGQKFWDWRMPTNHELNEMYLQMLAIDGFADNNYWSSTELDVNDAWRVRFSDGAPVNSNKNNSYIVRAVRAF